MRRPPGFAARTLERLPAPSRQHIWAVSLFYVALLIGGLLPIAGRFVVFTAYGDVVQQTAIFQALNQTIGVALQSGVAVVGAVGVVAADVVREAKPIVMGWLFLLIGIVATWRNVYRYMTRAVASRFRLVPANQEDNLTKNNETQTKQTTAVLFALLLLIMTVGVTFAGTADTRTVGPTRLSTVT